MFKDEEILIINQAIEIERKNNKKSSFEYRVYQSMDDIKNLNKNDIFYLTVCLGNFIYENNKEKDSVERIIDKLLNLID